MSASIHARRLRHVLIAGAVVVTAGAAVSGPAAASQSRPRTVPALREWTSTSGAFRLARSSRIVVAWQDRRALLSIARVFAADLRAMTRRRHQVVSGRYVPVRDGDIVLRLGTHDAQLGAEGYRVSIGHWVTVSANRAAGVFYGTRTLLQLLGHRRSIPGGVARDWPRYPERGLMVDIGRQYFTLRWLKREIRAMAYLKLNYLHLHFTENLGWRIESDSHPEIVSSQHLSKSDVASLITFARRYYVTVVPEVDMPGHMGAALEAHPELQLRNALGQPNPDALDYTLPAARQFAKQLIEEYIKLFPGPYWHMGADEFPMPQVDPSVADLQYPQLLSYAQRLYGPRANAQDAYIGFINWVDRIVRAHGKTLRVWNDDLAGANVVKLNPDVVVEWWDNPISPGPTAGPESFVSRGHSVFNASWVPTYFVSGGSPNGSWPGKPSMSWAYDSWQVNQFDGGDFLTAPLKYPSFRLPHVDPHNLGAELHEWNDNAGAETQTQIAYDIEPRLAVLSQKTWDTPPLTPSYTTFERITNSVRLPAVTP